LTLFKKIEPFDIDKTGFGAMSAWISVENINEIKNKKLALTSKTLLPKA